MRPDHQTTGRRPIQGLLLVHLALLLLHVASAQASSLTNENARAFLQCLVDHPESAHDFVGEDDLAIAQRLGISYPEAPSKALISWDLSEPIRELLRQSGIDGRFTIEDLGDGDSRVVLFPRDGTPTRSWVFRDGKLVSSILFRVRGWKQVDSPHFRFFISDTTLFHEANIAALEVFLTRAAALLGFTDADMDRLSQQKIYYCFCSSEDEIRELTGYAARGMYILSHDLIVSTYSAHFHELAHLLMNYRLGEPHLYTHPLLLEGFAVTAGGRGGKSPAILHQLGLGLHRAGWMSPDELLDTGSFRQLNASMSYPGSAPYNRFLLEYLGVAGYLELYARYGGDASAVSGMTIRKSELPPDAAWRRFLDEQPRTGSVTPGVGGLDVGADTFTFRPLPAGAQFGFAVPGITLALAGPAPAGYRSFLFEELLGDQPYAGERYLIRASAEEVGVYDLFTNTMIAHTAMAISGDPEDIPFIAGRYVFSVDRAVFPEDLGKVECRFPGD